MKICLIVLGMHRSGTSAIMGALQALGLPLGTDLMSAQVDNPKGFFENKYIVEKNDAILSSFDSAWDELFDLPDQWQENEDVVHIQDAICNYLLEEFKNEKIFGLKDPRLCVLMPVWLDIFERMEVKPVFILPLRHPIEVGMSLEKRNGFSMEKSLLLWRHYSACAEHYTRAFDRFFLPFERLMEQPQIAINHSLDQLQLGDFFSLDSSDVKEAEAGFIDVNLRHNLWKNADSRDSWSYVVEYYQEICSLVNCDKGDESAIEQRIDRANEKFHFFKELFDNPDHDKFKEIANEKEKINRDLQKQLQASLYDKTRLETQHSGQVDFLNNQIQNLQQRIANKERYINEVRSTLAWRIIARINRSFDNWCPENSLRLKTYQKLKGSLKIYADSGLAGIRQRIYRKWQQKTEDIKKNEILGMVSGIVFPDLSQVDTSIIIPVYNQSNFTLKCLRSVALHTTGNYEVIVVNNNSTDRTPQLLQEIPGIKVIHNTENKVFVDGCNQGAEIAHGKFLLFLNNDTEVKPGWLDALNVPFIDSTVGAVGAKLIYPDGTLQEAGSIIWQDGNGWNYGHGDDPNLPQYCYRREVDYCSGACLIVRKEIWDQLGGFDTRYAPAYYEDTDLCFGIRSLGYKVMYQPEAVIVHYGGASAGKDTSSGYKRYQDINRTKFVEKWRSTLSTKHYEGPDYLHLARERGREEQILVIDHYVPRFDQDSGSLRMFQILEILSERGSKIVFWPDDGACNPQYVEPLQRMGIEVLYGPMGFESYIRKAGPYFDFVLLSRPYIVRRYIDLIKKYSDAKTIYDTVDLHYLREQRRAEIEIKKIRELEFGLANTCDATLVVSPIEKELLSKEQFGHKVHVVSNIHQLEPVDTSFDARKGGIFIGGFDHTPNVNGIIWFVNNILPKIRVQIPDFKLTIIGSNPPLEVTSLACEHVEVTGYVEDVSDYFKQAKVFVSPLLYGAGVKGKIGHSFSYGLPVVTTPIGAEGMNLENRKHAIIAKNAEDFAAGVVDLYTDEKLWRELSLNCKILLEKYFSKGCAKRSLDAILSSEEEQPKKTSGKERNIVVHCHLFKNAGTTFDWVLNRNFGSSFVDHREDEMMLKGGKEYLSSFILARPALVAVSSHHLPLPLPEIPDIIMHLAVFLRHPIDRAGSVYKFERRQEAETPGAINAKKLSFAEYVKWRMDPEVGATIRNFQVLRLASHKEINRGGSPLENALNCIAETPLLGIVERFDESMVLFETALKEHFQDVDLAYVKQNVTAERSKTMESRLVDIEDELGADVITELYKSNELDLKLYEAGVELLKERIGKIEGFDKKLDDFRNRCAALTGKA